MLARIKSAWRTPVPLLVRVIAIAAAVVGGLVIGPKVTAGQPLMVGYLISFAVGAAIVIVVLLGWQAIERSRGA
jgi:hypothetical protein